MAIPVSKCGHCICGNLLAYGDYVDGPYPATLEGAVRSAMAAVAQLTPGQRPVTTC
jgi:hypothetical protein